MCASSVCLVVWCQTVCDWVGKPSVFSTMVFMSRIEVFSFTVRHRVGPSGGVIITSHSFSAISFWGGFVCVGRCNSIQVVSGVGCVGMVLSLVVVVC